MDDSEVEYRDAVTGELVDPSLVQSGRYKPFEPTWGQSIGAGVVTGLGSIAKAGGGLAQAAMDTTSWGYQPDAAVRDWVDKYTAPYQQQLDSIPEDSYKKYAGIAGNIGTQIAPALLTGPLGAAAYFGAQGFGRKYDELSQLESQGQELPGGKTYPSIISGGTDALTSLPITRPFKGLGLANAAKSAAKNVVAGAGAGATQQLGDMYSTYKGTGEGYSPEEIKSRVGTGAAFGGVLSGLTSAASSAKANIQASKAKTVATQLETNFDNRIAEVTKEQPVVSEPAPIPESPAVPEPVAQPDPQRIAEPLPPPEAPVEVPSVPEQAAPQIPETPPTPQPKRGRGRPRKAVIEETRDINKPAELAPPDPAEVQSLPPEQQQTASLARKILSENSGAIRVDGDVIKNKIIRIFKPEAMPEIPEAQNEVSALSRFVQGRVGKDYAYRIPVISDILKNSRHILTYSRTISDKFPKVANVYNDGLRIFDDANAVATTFRNRMEKYSSLTPESTSKVNAYMISIHRAAARLSGTGQKIVETPEFLAKMGLAPNEIAAIRQVRETMDYSLDLLYNGMVDIDGLPPEVARAETEKLRSKLYVPSSRFGSHYAFGQKVDGAGEAIKDADGKEIPVYFSRHDTPEEAAAALKKIKAEGYNKIRGGILNKSDIAVSETISPSVMIRAMQNGIDPATISHSDLAKHGIPVTGLLAHKQHKTFALGESQDLRRSMAEYFYSVSMGLARKRFDVDIMKRIAALPENSTEAAWIQNYRKDMATKAGKEYQRMMSRAATLFYLPNTKTIGVNLLTPLTTTFPEAVADLGSKKGLSAWAKGTKLATMKLFGRKLPDDVQAFLNYGNQKGRFADSEVRAYKGQAMSGSTEKTFTDKVLTVNSMTEGATRIHGGLVGYEIAKAKGLYGQDAFDYALDFTLRSNYDYSEANFNKIDVHFPALNIFKRYTGSWIRQLRNNMTKDRWKGAAAQLGMAFAFAGIRGIPGVRDAMNGAALAGWDPSTEIRKLFGKENRDWAEIAIYGSLRSIGFDISGSLGMEFAPNLEQGPLSSATSLALGPVMDAGVMRPKRAIELAMDGQYDLALETISPPLIRGPLKAYRAYREGGLRTPNIKDGKLLKDPSAFELAQIATNFTPTRLANQYDKRHMFATLQTRAQNRSARKSRIQGQAARALAAGDKAGANRIISNEMSKVARGELDLKSMPDIGKSVDLVVDYNMPDLARAKTLPDDLEMEYLKNLELYK